MVAAALARIQVLKFFDFQFVAVDVAQGEIHIVLHLELSLNLCFHIGDERKGASVVGDVGGHACFKSFAAADYQSLCCYSEYCHN